MSDTLRNPYALVNGELVHINKFEKFMSRQAKCPNCNISMIHVSETKRGGSICRAHFRHNGEPCPNDEYEKTISEYTAAAQDKKYRYLLENPNGDAEEIITAMIKIRPSIEVSCCSCGKVKKRDLSSGAWERLRSDRILVNLKFSEKLIISFPNSSSTTPNLPHRTYHMTVDLSKPLVSVEDDLFPCMSCTMKFDAVANDEMAARVKIANNDFALIRKLFRAGIDESVYFSAGRYTAQKMDDVWTKDKTYFYADVGDDDVHEQTEEWFKRKFKGDKLIIDIIGYQLKVYYDHARSERSKRAELETVKDMRDDLLDETMNKLNKIATLEERFEDYLTCSFGKNKGTSYYQISSKYLHWLIGESDVFQKMSKPQQFFILDAYMVRKH